MSFNISELLTFNLAKVDTSARCSTYGPPAWSYSLLYKVHLKSWWKEKIQKNRKKKNKEKKQRKHKESINCILE